MLSNLIEQLIKFQGVSPGDGGVIAFLKNYLEELGFYVKIIETKGSPTIKSLYAKLIKHKEVDICFAGHVDVVPPGSLADWKSSPFEPKYAEDKIYGRGIVDMKAAICCFIIAAYEFIEDIQMDSTHKEALPGFNSQVAEAINKGLNIAIILTSDEETYSQGARAVIDYLKKNNEEILNCIIGEPTCEEKLGDTIKVGRRGSINFTVKVKGKQGHVAYPHLAKNSIHALVKGTEALLNYKFDEGNQYFQASHCEITNIIVDNAFDNIIPAEAKVNFNIRFNNLHTVDSLHKIVEKIFKFSNYKVDIEYREQPALPFLSKALNLNANDINSLNSNGGGESDKRKIVSAQPNLTNVIDIFSKAVERVINIKPKLSTSGGTSEARFFNDISNVIEFGLLSKTAHQANENSSIEDIYLLKNIYKAFLEALANKANA